MRRGRLSPKSFTTQTASNERMKSLLVPKGVQYESTLDSYCLEKRY
jgi:hypothetical protein